MDRLKFLVIFILLTVGISNGNGEENREGRGWGQQGYSKHRRPAHKSHYSIKRPSYGGHVSPKFNNKIRFVEKAQPPSAEQQQPDPEVEAIISSIWNQDNQSPFVPVENENQEFQFDVRGDDLPVPESLESSPSRITITEDGDVVFGRALNFNRLKTFHDESSFDHNHDHDHITEEDHDHTHKSFRTARNLPRYPGRPEQLSTTLTGIQQQNAEGLQIISTNQGAQAWNDGGVNASGGDILYASSGDSNVYGAGVMGSAGVVTVTSSGESTYTGWKAAGSGGEAQTFQGIGVGNTAQASEYLDATLSGLAVSLNSSGSSSSTGSGTSSATGTTSVVSSGAASGGWRAGSTSGGDAQTFQGIGVGNTAQASEYLDATLSGLAVSLNSSGSSSSTGSGTSSATGTTSVVSSGATSGGWKTGSSSGTGANMGSSGGSSVTGSGAISAYGTTHVSNSGGNNNNNGWGPQ